MAHAVVDSCLAPPHELCQVARSSLKPSMCRSCNEHTTALCGLVLLTRMQQLTAGLSITSLACSSGSHWNGTRSTGRFSRPASMARKSTWCARCHCTRQSWQKIQGNATAGCAVQAWLLFVAPAVEAALLNQDWRCVSVSHVLG